MHISKEGVSIGRWSWVPQEGWAYDGTNHGSSEPTNWLAPSEVWGSYKAAWRARFWWANRTVLGQWVSNLHTPCWSCGHRHVRSWCPSQGEK